MRTTELYVSSVESEARILSNLIGIVFIDVVILYLFYIYYLQWTGVNQPLLCQISCSRNFKIWRVLLRTVYLYG